MNKFNPIRTVLSVVSSAFVLSFFVASDARAADEDLMDCYAGFQAEVAACAKLESPVTLQCLHLWITGKIGGGDCLSEPCNQDPGFLCLAAAHRNLESCLRGERRSAFYPVCVKKFGAKSIME